jgi:DNA polymerase-3 subunit gamma/tau
MSYTVIARRFRPKRFEEVVGQPHIVTTLRNAVRSGRVGHAYLFTGQRGVGKTSVARILAKATNCLGVIDGEPCGTCENCLSIDGGHFVDIIEIDAATNTGIDDIRELQETVRYFPMKGRYKVYIIDECHRLSRNAFDGLLKTLEEPSGHNIFILASTEPQSMPYTIQSRCQRFDFRRMTESEIVEQLKKICDHEHVGYDEKAFTYIVREADGSMRDAQSLLDQVIAYAGDHISEKQVTDVIGVVAREYVYEIMKSILEQEPRSGLELIERTLEMGYDVYQAYRSLVSFTREMMLVKLWNGKPPFLFLDDQEYEQIDGLIKGIEYYEIQNMLNYMLQAEDLVRGVFPKVSFEVLFINLYNISQLRDVEKVLNGLEPRDIPQRHEAPPAEEPVKEPVRSVDAKGFVEFLKSKKPFIGGMLASLQIKVEEKRLILSLDERSAIMRKDAGTISDVKRLASEFFGREMDISFADAGTTNSLQDYVREAESLFNS